MRRVFSSSSQRLFLGAFLLFVATFGFAQRPDNQVWQGAWDGNVEQVRSAVDKGANVNVRGKGGWAPLLVAARNGHFDVVQYLVEHGADIEQSDNSRDKTPLLAAAFKGHYDIVKYLVDKGAKVNVQAINGWTPLHDAAYVGSVDVVKYLVDHGADLSIRNKDGQTALEAAEFAVKTQNPIRHGRTTASPQDYQEVISYLKSHGG
jgi:ankyrin repeat protein